MTPSTSLTRIGRSREDVLADWNEQQADLLQLQAFADVLQANTGYVPTRIAADIRRRSALADRILTIAFQAGRLTGRGDGRDGFRFPQMRHASLGGQLASAA